MNEFIFPITTLYTYRPRIAFFKGDGERVPIAIGRYNYIDQGDTINLKLTSENGLHGCSEEDWIYFTGQYLT